MRRTVSNVDLNLLRTLDALLTHQSVQRAARHLGLSQPATSYALNRLRTAFSDELLVRTSGGMALTPRAQLLLTPTREALGRVEAVFANSPLFDPATCTRTFTLAMPDHAQLLLSTPLARAIEVEAPLVNFVLRGLPEELEDALESGRADLVLSIPAPASSSVLRQKVLEASMVQLARKRPPLRKGQTRSLPVNVVMALPSDNPSLRAGPLALSTPSLLVAASVVAVTDSVMHAPRHVAVKLTQMFDVERCGPANNLPIPVVAQHWHQLQNADPAHAWLRGLVRRLCSGLESTVA